MLDGAILRFDQAEAKALTAMQNAGFPVRSISEAREIQAEYREAARLQAHALARMSVIAQGGRKR
ncbi:hypothetical protein [Microbacterium allomyrinae]|uniref:Uncharacterized protein n=1 Tax=Microbacterium allomyrinae TaxID=2830666 RepID=A0A9X1LRX9_9MICO|nr:hypothetical protein [Microbacterium allomyrinae]MCC2030636.1 hypothetical protein [Microbacterium allomyrinae]